MTGFESLIERLQTRQTPTLSTSAPTVSDGSLAVLRLCDLHAGRLHFLDERLWSLEQFTTVCRNAVVDLIALLLKHQPISQEMIVMGDDISHINDDRSETLGGTRVESCASVERIATTVTEFMIWTAEYCHQHLARNVELIFIPGNHDSLLGFMCARVVEAYFHSHAGINVDAHRNPRKARLFKQVLVAFDHGEWIPAARMASVIPTMWPEYYAASKYRIVHMGHYHKTKLVKPLIEFADGVLVRYSPSIAPIDKFHNDRCFLGEEACEAFVYNDVGLVSTMVVRARE